MTGRTYGKPAAVLLVERGLVAAIGVCLLIAGLLYFVVGERPSRVPYLNTQLLPNEAAADSVSPENSLERPLFWPARRPVALQAEMPLDKEEAGEDELVEPLEGVRLLGIMIKGESFTALLDVEGKVVRVQQGASIKQWSVSDISAREVHFSWRGKKSVLSLEREIHQSIKLES